jgi:hypothetical protein
VPGIPVNIGAKNLKFGKITFDVPEESDNTPYPVNLWLKVEPAEDRHVLTVDIRDCNVYELFSARRYLKAYSGAKWDMKSNAMRTGGFTSADAAGLPITPLLVDPDELPTGFDHMFRITLEKTSGYQWPGSHYTDGNGLVTPSRPPLGAVMRLKRSFNITPYPYEIRRVLAGLMKHGAIVADNGGDMFLSGVPSPIWNDANLALLDIVRTSDFEFVDTSCMQVSPNSYKVKLCPGMPAKTCKKVSVLVGVLAKGLCAYTKTDDKYTIMVGAAITNLSAPVLYSFDGFSF